MKRLCSARSASVLVAWAAISLAGCVQINRFQYVSLEDVNGIQLDGEVMPDCLNLTFVSPIPAAYTLARPDYSLRFESQTTGCSGGVWISAVSPSGEPLRVTSQEPPLAKPRYGPCRAYYFYDRPSDRYFFDACPGSLSRSFFISIDVVGPDGVVGQERIPYEARRDGFWWVPDLL